jgi:hypothetical protein
VDGGGDVGARTWSLAEVWRLFALFLGSPPDPTSSPSSPGDPAAFRLRSSAAGRCLDISGANPANGTPAVIWDCHTNPNQQFRRSGSALQVIGKCLDAPAGATAGTRVQIWDCTGGANQQWTFNGNDTISGPAGLCLDVNGNATANGTAVILWTCTGAANQRWTRA